MDNSSKTPLNGPRARYGALNASQQASPNSGGDRTSQHEHLPPLELDTHALDQSRRLMIVFALITFLFAILHLIGAIVAYSLCLLVNTSGMDNSPHDYKHGQFAAYCVILARLLFLAFLTECTGKPTTRLDEYRRWHKKGGVIIKTDS